MLTVPETAQSGTRKEIPPPCYRCLFDKPIQDNWCDPETCEMLTAWLTDDEFLWDKYYFKWSLNLELKMAKLNGSSAEE